MTTRLHIIEPQSGGAYEVQAGSTIRIIDPQGSQVADVFALSLDDPLQWMSTAHTRTVTRRLFPIVGEQFVTNQYQPILSFVADSSPGKHDMLYPACEPAMYARLKVDGYHPSCRENFGSAVAASGHGPYVMPDPVNIFQNSPVTANGRLVPDVAASSAGDAVTLRAHMNLLLVVTACSQDVVAINGDRCTEIHVEISAPGQP